jgi:hypothetical protein
MLLHDDSRFVPWLRARIEETPWWHEAPGLEIRSFLAYRLGYFTGPGEVAFVVQVEGVQEGNKQRHRSALFLVRSKDVSRNDRPEATAPPERLWSNTEGGLVRDLGMMRGDDGISVLYWEVIPPSKGTPGRSGEGIQPVGRAEVMGHGWLAWARNGRLVVRKKTCRIIPPV